MSYLDELLAGYQQGLVDDRPQPVQALRAALAEASDPRQRGALLGMLAQSLASRPNRNDTRSMPGARGGAVPAAVPARRPVAI